MLQELQNNNLLIDRTSEVLTSSCSDPLSEQIFWIVSGIFNPITGFFTQGLADTLCLDTLRHGTSWRNYIEIRMHGAKPALGSTGACVGMLIDARNSKSQENVRKANFYFQNSSGYFFAIRDSSTIGRDFQDHIIDIFARFDYEGVSNIGMGRVTNKPLTLRQKCLNQIFIRTVPFFYSLQAGIAIGAKPDDKGHVAKIKRVASGFFNMLSPAVKFRFRPEDVKDSFEDDPLMIGSAIRTNKIISRDHLGLNGILKQGCDGKICQRMTKDPGKALWGLIRLINPIGIMFLFILGAYIVKQENLEGWKVKRK